MVPYVVKVFGDHLGALMVGVRFASKFPAAKPAKLVVITTSPAGASEKPDHLSWRRVTFQCSDTAGELASYNLCETVRKHVLASRFASIGVRVVDIIGEPANLPDPDDGSDRFQLTADVLMRVAP